MKNIFRAGNRDDKGKFENREFENYLEEAL